jgi:hypothetical protein
LHDEKGAMIIILSKYEESSQFAHTTLCFGSRITSVSLLLDMEHTIKTHNQVHAHAIHNYNPLRIFRDGPLGFSVHVRQSPHATSQTKHTKPKVQ